MKKSIFVTMCLSLTLVLAFAASAFATTISWTGAGPFYATGAAPGDPIFTKPTTAWTGDTGTPLSGGGTFNMNLLLHGSWDSPFDVEGNLDKAIPRSEWDAFRVQVFRGGTGAGNLVSDLTFNDYPRFDNANGATLKPVSLSIDLPTIEGVYFFKAWGEVTRGGLDESNSNEHWELVDANITPTPLPGAVWLLGSGLLGFMGFKRTRRNAA